MPPITPTPTYPTPILRLKLHDLSSKGSTLFLTSIPLTSLLQDAVTSVLTNLYPTSTHWQPVRSITLILESFGGVAFTTGKRIDDDHKEIHFSTDYIEQVDGARVAHEITGVVVHEMVHCWQHNGKGTCPGGLIEGIADWVRLKAGYAPPHWTREAGGEWDAGYQTTGYFLEWLEREHGKEAVVKINESLRLEEYDEEVFWKRLFGKHVRGLWADYKKWLERYHGDDGGDEAAKPIPTHAARPL